MRLRRLNASGIEYLSKFLDSLTTELPEPYPSGILTAAETSERVDPEVEIEPQFFKTRFELAEYLNERLSRINDVVLERDRGLWSWLALLFFEDLCTMDRRGRPKPGERARWIPAMGNFRKYYRHLLAGPFHIYRAHRDNPRRVLAVLAGKPQQPGDIAEQLVSRQELVTNPAIMEAATRLYVSQDGSIKRGAAGRGRGSVRRLADILNQFDVTWDLYAMSPDRILEMLPAEFDKYRR